MRVAKKKLHSIMYGLGKILYRFRLSKISYIFTISVTEYFFNINAHKLQTLT